MLSSTTMPISSVDTSVLSLKVFGLAEKHKINFLRAFFFYYNFGMHLNENLLPAAASTITIEMKVTNNLWSIAKNNGLKSLAVE